MVEREFWVFAYGSLMWNPGFAWEQRVPARLHGFHRAMCIYSHVWRGTPERPGLVLGLDRGGSCRGLAYRIDPRLEPEVTDYLEARERVTAVYLGKRLAVTLEGAGAAAAKEPPRRALALTYVADRGHHQYAGRLPEAEAARLIRQGRGRGGLNTDYLESAVRHLAALDMPDGPLTRLHRLVREEKR
ncbi:MAG: gamma-glutamylcyclotransferase [Alphaproteobacteria bacterium]|nr:gamma-glutamylcyclotransferase [Alphaproteobacteria bacterium]